MPSNFKTCPACGGGILLKSNDGDDITLLDEINKCHSISGVDAYTRDVLSRCHREIVRLRKIAGKCTYCKGAGYIVEANN